MKEWTVQELKDRLDRREKFFIFDVRSREGFSAWRIESRQGPPILNVPYYEMTEHTGQAELSEAAVHYAQSELTEKLPKDQPIVTVCALGKTSQFIAQGLRRLGYDAVSLQGGMAAWGNLYECKSVTEGREFRVYQISRPARGCLSYVIVSQGEAVVIDPLRHIENYLDFAREQNFKIKLILDTHGHADHISGGRALAEHLRVPYYLHPYDAIHPMDILPAQIPYEPLRHAQAFSVGTTKLKTIHIPGHTLGNVAYLLNEQYLFTGDSIFIESISRPDLGGRGETWAPLHYHSLRRLLELPDSVIVLPGHFSSPKEANLRGLFAAPLGELGQKNEGLCMAQKSEEEFVRYILSSLPVFPPQYLDIKRVNMGLLVYDDEKASELEMGRNVCALAKAPKT